MCHQCTPSNAKNPLFIFKCNTYLLRDKNLCLVRLLSTIFFDELKACPWLQGSSSPVFFLSSSEFNFRNTVIQPIILFHTPPLCATDSYVWLGGSPFWKKKIEDFERKKNISRGHFLLLRSGWTLNLILWTILGNSSPYLLLYTIMVYMQLHIWYMKRKGTLLYV